MALNELSSARIEETSDRQSAARLSPPAAGSAAGTVGYDWNIATDTITWGNNLADLVGFVDLEAFATGRGYAEHWSPDSPGSRFEAVMAPGGCDTGGGVAFQVIYGLTPGPRSGVPPIWVEDSGRWFADAEGRPSLAHGVIRVVTERYEAERQRALAAQCDPVTGAMNRSYFIEHIVRHLALSGRKHTTFGVLLWELAAPPRDTKGDGDAGVVLAAIAGRMRQQMRTSEALACLDDTCFAMLLENCNGEQMAAAARRLMAAASESPIPLPGGPAVAALRVGGVIAPLYGRTPAAILQFAREALDMARQTPGGGFVRYDPDMASTAVRRKLSQATDEIISALNEGRVVLALQPIVHAATRDIAFCEALVRIRCLDGTLLMPDVLVPAAEQGGLVALLDRRVVDLAFAQLVADRHLSLSVNASVTSLHDPDWQDHFRAVCRRHPGAASRLTVEITETCAVADLDATRAVLLALKALDIKIAIDDFGSGHSSFRNLRDLPIDYLKIDGAFARNLAQSPDDRFFIQTLIDLAKNLRIPTIAEWIEDEETAGILTGWGIDLLQGHLFGRAEVAPIGDAVAAFG